MTHIPEFENVLICCTNAGSAYIFFKTQDEITSPAKALITIEGIGPFFRI